MTLNSTAQSLFLSRLLPIAYLLLFFAGDVIGQNFEVSRLNNGQPIISRLLFEASGATPEEAASISGPSVIRVPDWIPASERAAPEAKYYLYFAHHMGRYIRMAWAATIEGDWHLYRGGQGDSEGDRGVLDLGVDREIHLDGSLTLKNHVASPDVHVDNAGKRVVMYFHSPVYHKGQRLPGQMSMVAISRTGLSFSEDIQPVILGDSYFRVFEHGGRQYALSYDNIFSNPNAPLDWSVPEGFDPKRPLWAQRQTQFFPNARERAVDDTQPGKIRIRIRHAGLYKSNDMLYIFHTLRGDSPERIYVNSIDLRKEDWQNSIPSISWREVMRAQMVWEGSEVPPRPSKRGIAKTLENALRDPYVLEDSGKLYLFYAGGGEQAIGVALLTATNDQPFR